MHNAIYLLCVIIINKVWIIRLKVFLYISDSIWIFIVFLCSCCVGYICLLVGWLAVALLIGVLLLFIAIGMYFFFFFEYWNAGYCSWRCVGVGCFACACMIWIRVWPGHWFQCFVVCVLHGKFDGGAWLNKFQVTKYSIGISSSRNFALEISALDNEIFVVQLFHYLNRLNSLNLVPFVLLS